MSFNPAMIGLKFGKLTVIGYDVEGSRISTKKRRKPCSKYICTCSCGNLCSVTDSRLRSEHQKSCRGPMHTRKASIKKDLSGQTFGRLTVLSLHSNGGGTTFYNCLCECGKNIITSRQKLISGDKKSCGCLVIKHGENRKSCVCLGVDSRTKHGENRSGMIKKQIRSSLYNWWSTKKALKDLDNLWHEFKICRDWFRSRGYEDGFKIKKLNPEKPFSPENCEFFDEFPAEKIELYDFQSKVLEKTKEFNKVAYYLDMGLGKTFVGSEKLIDLNAEYNLVICQKSKFYDWYRHFKVYYPDKNIKKVLFNTCLASKELISGDIKPGIYLTTYSKFYAVSSIHTLEPVPIDLNTQA